MQIQILQDIYKAEGNKQHLWQRQFMLETLTSFLLKGAGPHFTDSKGTSTNKEQC